MRTGADIVIVMGVSGSGKTTVARGIAVSTHRLFAEGDDFHPRANVEKMRAGHPLTDADRRPWLRSVGAWIGERERAGTPAVVACSALRRAHRDLLREGNPGVRFCHVIAPEAVLHNRMEHRPGHFMPPSLLRSQLETLEPLHPDEPGVSVSGAGPEQTVLAAALTALGLSPSD